MRGERSGSTPPPARASGPAAAGPVADLPVKAAAVGLLLDAAATPRARAAQPQAAGAHAGGQAGDWPLQEPPPQVQASQAACPRRAPSVSTRPATPATSAQEQLPRIASRLTVLSSADAIGGTVSQDDAEGGKTDARPPTGQQPPPKPAPRAPIRCINHAHRPEGMPESQRVWHCMLCTPAPSKAEEKNYELVGDPGLKNGEKKLRGLIVRMPEWEQELSREAFATAIDADPEEKDKKLAQLLRTKDVPGLRKSHLLDMARYWEFGSDIWHKKGDAPRRRAAAKAAQQGRFSIPRHRKPALLPPPGLIHAVPVADAGGGGFGSIGQGLRGLIAEQSEGGASEATACSFGNDRPTGAAAAIAETGSQRPVRRCTTRAKARRGSDEAADAPERGLLPPPSKRARGAKTARASGRGRLAASSTNDLCAFFDADHRHASPGSVNALPDASLPVAEGGLFMPSSLPAAPATSLPSMSLPPPLGLLPPLSTLLSPSPAPLHFTSISPSPAPELLLYDGAGDHGTLIVPHAAPPALGDLPGAPLATRNIEGWLESIATMQPPSNATLDQFLTLGSNN